MVEMRIDLTYFNFRTWAAMEIR